MFLDGAGWDRKHSVLVEAKNKILYTPMPVIHIYAINSTEPKDSALYEVKSNLAYFKIQIQIIFFYFSVPCLQETQQNWIKLHHSTVVENYCFSRSLDFERSCSFVRYQVKPIQIWSIIFLYGTQFLANKFIF